MKYLKSYNESITDNLDIYKEIISDELCEWEHNKKTEDMTESDFSILKGYFSVLPNIRKVSIVRSVFGNNIFRTTIEIEKFYQYDEYPSAVFDIHISKYEDEYYICELHYCFYSDGSGWKYRSYIFDQLDSIPRFVEILMDLIKEVNPYISESVKLDSDICKLITDTTLDTSRDKKLVPLNKSDLKILNEINSKSIEICEKNGYETETSIGKVGCYYSIITPISKFDAIGLYIKKYEDEYYIGEIYNLAMIDDKWQELINMKSDIYLCDQLEGLEELGKIFTDSLSMEDIKYYISKNTIPE